MPLKRISDRIVTKASSWSWKTVKRGDSSHQRVITTLARRIIAGTRRVIKKRALGAYGKAEKLAPKFAPTYMRLGMHHMKKGNKSKARSYFKRYLRLADKNARDRSYAQQYLKSL